MFIRYTKVNIHTLSSHDGKRLATLRPGWNEFDDAIWEQNKNDKEVLQMIEDGTIEVSDVVVKTKVKGKTVTKALGQNGEEVAIKDLEEAKSLKFVRETFDVKLLTRWMDEETRHKVKRALTEKLEAINKA